MPHSKCELKIFLNGELERSLNLSEEQEYHFGRGADSDFVIKASNGISRQHFKIFFDGASWTIEVLSKFGGVSLHGADIQHHSLQNGDTFQLMSYEFIFTDSQAQDIESNQASQDNPVAAAQALSLQNAKEVSQQDRTIVEESAGIPYLKMMQVNGDTNSLRLEGNLWTAGRDTSCEIIIKDRGASRRHFELSIAGNQAYIVDLNSANGTLVNGEKIATDQATPIHSGDTITVLSVNMMLEIRDPNFEKQLQSMPAQMAGPVDLSQQLSTTPSGIPMPPTNNQTATTSSQKALIKPSLKTIKQWENWQVDFRKKKHRLGDHKKKLFAGVAILLIAFALGTPTGPQKPKKSRLPANVHEAFGNLTEDKKILIRDTYKLAKNLYLKRNYPLALKELNEIHEMIPFYEDSVKLAAECKQYIEIKEQQEYIARQKQAAAELERRINAKVYECRQQMNPKTTMEQLFRCLGRAVDLNPDHPGIRQLREVIEEREAQARLLASQQAEFRKKAARGRQLFNKANNLEKSGKDYSAIKAYNRYLRSGLPDPTGLKPKARRSLASLQNNLKFKVDSLIRRSQSYFDQSNYSEAMKVLQETEKVDPSNPLIGETRQKFQKQISRQMKAIYQDSVLEESLGNIEAAKDKWRKIKELSYPEDPYYRKALAKLKKVGG